MINDDVIVGIDLEIGSSPQSLRKARYAVYISNVKSAKEQEYRNLTLDQIYDLLKHVKPHYLGTDNIQELGGTTEELIEFLSSLPKKTKVIQVTKSNGEARSLMALMKENQLPVHKKPGPLQTAKLCSYFISLGIGSILTEIEGDGRVLWKNFANYHVETARYRKKDTDEPHSPPELTSKQLVKYLNKYPEIKKVHTIIGQGKEAIVSLVSDRHDHLQVVKTFQLYSPMANEVKSKIYKLKSWGVPLQMAKREARNLQYLAQHGVSVPKLLHYDGPLVIMEPILKANSSDELAPQLSKVNLKQYGPPVDYFYLALEELYKMFKEAFVVHGDFSPQNLLFTEEKLYVIDVRQAELINMNTFTDTPVRIRIDRALKILDKDLQVLIDYFERKYRLTIDRMQIYDEFYQTIPKKFQEKLE
ncbi:MAG: RIO1 family regulatory kinase/ATPase domain-containing protein [Candidatus Kariarchaeaceae archaeon]|jgi:RIO-like serine/threonine protein kinase